MVETAGTEVAKLVKEYDSYCDIFICNKLGCVTIKKSLFATSNGMVFLEMLSGDQVCMVHSIGRLSCRIGKHTPAHNRIFGILGEKVEYQLPPISVVPEAGLLPWFEMEERYQTIAANIEILETAQ